MIDAEAKQLLGGRVVGRAVRERADVRDTGECLHATPQEARERIDERVREDGVEELLLVREVQVHVARRDASRFRDLRHRGGRIALAREHLERRAADPLADLFLQNLRHALSRSGFNNE